MQRMYDNCSNISCTDQCDEVEKTIKSPFPKYYSVAMAYIPFQNNPDTYDSVKALERGTLFPVLDKPFMGGGVR